MKVLLLDVAYDLRAKRLWPLAALLLVVIVAFPLILLRGDDAQTAPAGSAPEVAAGSPADIIRLVDGPSSGRASRLEVFNAHDPFRPDRRDASTQESLGSPARPGGPPAGDQLQSAPAPAPAEQPTTEADPPPGEAADEVKPVQPKGREKIKPAPAPASPEVRVVSYSADLAYGRAGQVRPHDDVRVLSLIPKQRRLIQFAGVSADGEQGVFTILDPDLEAGEGDGRCARVAGRCTVLRLEAGEERRFTDADAEGFRLRLASLAPMQRSLSDLPPAVREALARLR